MRHFLLYMTKLWFVCGCNGIHGALLYRTLFEYTRGADPSRPVTFVCGRDYNVDKVVWHVSVALYGLLDPLPRSSMMDYVTTAPWS